MIDLMDKGALRARFAELCTDREARLARSRPLREERDLITAEAAERTAALDEQIREIEEGMFDRDQESATIARALGGRTGADAAA